MGIPDHLACFLRNLYAGQEATVRTGHETADWFQIANIWWIIEKAREFQKNIYFSFIDHAKAFDCIDNNNCGKFLKRWDYQTTLPASWEAWMQVKKQQLKPDMEPQTGSKLGKECIKAVYCHPVYLTSVQCAAGSMAGRDRKWSTQSLGKRN